MNLDELIQALTELKESGRAVDKAPVYFDENRINTVSIEGDCNYRIILE